MKLLYYIGAIALFVALAYGIHRAAVWTDRDAILRGKSPFIVKCAVIFFFPWGLVAWLLFRPDPIDTPPQNKTDFDLNDYRQQ